MLRRAAVGLTACLFACGRLHFDPTGDDPAGADASGVPACTSFGPWGDLTPIGPASTDEETGPWLSPNGLSLWFARGPQSTCCSVIYQVQRSSRSVPFDLALATQVSIASNPSVPEGGTVIVLTDDELALFYQHYQSTTNVMVTTRSTTSDTFGVPGGLGFDRDGQIDTGDAALSPDGLTMLYGQWMGGGTPEQVYVTTRTSSTDDFGPGLAISGLDANINGFSFPADRSILFWASRPATSPSVLVSAPWPTPTAVGTPSIVENQPAAPADNIHPMLSRDGLTLVFASDAQGGNGHDLYQLSRSCQ